MKTCKILMILTSHRLDCFSLCMDLVLHSGASERFDKVVLLLNGVEGRHLQYIKDLQASHPEVPWDVVSGARGRGTFISNLQNECVRRYPDSLYFKLDEDTFVSSDWDQRLLAAYEAHRSDDDLSLITPVIPNNGLGSNYLLTAFPELGEEYSRRFGAPITPQHDGPVWINPDIANWLMRKFLNMDKANRQLREVKGEVFRKFSRRFSINCLCYDYRHWSEMGGIPEFDEVGWGDWIVAQKKFGVLVTDSLVHHYSFFVQQDWLDRTSLLEDLRKANLPETVTGFESAFQLPRLVRIAKQAPRVVRRKLGLGAG